jgi:hypothetical protein
MRMIRRRTRRRRNTAGRRLDRGGEEGTQREGSPQLRGEDNNDNDNDNHNHNGKNTVNDNDGEKEGSRPLNARRRRRWGQGGRVADR